MAQEVKIILTDDIDGGEATQTVDFAFRGKDYTIDLSDDNADKLEEALAPFIKAARRGSGRGTRSTGRSASRPASDKDKLTQIRQWAKDQGYEVSERGRIKGEVLDAYAAAH